ncbi:MAG TPA: bacteriocin [Spirochaetota bacterium]|nr:bacteriocin [Spirochaetota bacterium]
MEKKDQKKDVNKDKNVKVDDKKKKDVLSEKDLDNVSGGAGDRPGNRHGR